jgi:hypothetical protein
MRLSFKDTIRRWYYRVVAACGTPTMNVWDYGNGNLDFPHHDDVLEKAEIDFEAHELRLIIKTHFAMQLVGSFFQLIPWRRVVFVIEYESDDKHPVRFTNELVDFEILDMGIDQDKNFYIQGCIDSVACKVKSWRYEKAKWTVIKREKPHGK